MLLFCMGNSFFPFWRTVLLGNNFSSSCFLELNELEAWGSFAIFLRKQIRIRFFYLEPWKVEFQGCYVPHVIPSALKLLNSEFICLRTSILE
jgi:hypothetical protein